MSDDMTAPAPKPERRSPRWVKILLTLSLALNLAVIGLAAGAMWRIGGDDRFGGGPPRGDRTSFALIRALDGPDRRALFQSVRAAMPDAASPRHSRTEMSAMLELLRAPELDIDGLQALTRARFQNGVARQEAVAKVWLAKVQTMSADERAEYAQRIEDLLRKGGKPKNKK